MSVNPVVSTLDPLLLQPEPTATQKKEDPLGRDAFLKMLIAQLQHQDPLNPMEGSDFSAQLAQFSSLEQLFNVNDHLKTMSQSLEAKGKENVLDYIGKEIRSEDNTLKMEDGVVSGGVYTLTEPTDLAVSIYDEVGREVLTLYPGQKAAGTYKVQWNGVDGSGKTAPDGTYRFALAAVGTDGGLIPIDTVVSGVVTGVTYKGGAPYLEVGGYTIDPDAVVKVQTPAGAPDQEVGGYTSDPDAVVKVQTPAGA